jgi:hypothetical protein
MPRRPKPDQAAAARRLLDRARCEPLIALETEAVTLLGCSPAYAREYVISGHPRVRPPVWLDALHRPGCGWLTSLAACLRFVRELAEREEVERDPGYEAAVMYGLGCAAGDGSGMVAVEGVPVRRRAGSRSPTPGRTGLCTSGGRGQSSGHG